VPKKLFQLVESSRSKPTGHYNSKFQEPNSKKDKNDEANLVGELNPKKLYSSEKISPVFEWRLPFFCNVIWNIRLI